MFRATHPHHQELKTLIAASGFTYILAAGRCDGSAIAAAGIQKRM